MSPLFLFYILEFSIAFSSITQSCPTLCDPHGLQHTRLPYLSPTPGACSNSCPLSQWYHPTISSSVVPFSCLQSFPASRSFLRSQLFTSGGQSIGASASSSFFLVNIQGWFPLGFADLVSCSPRETLKSSPVPQFESINSTLSLYGPTLIFIHDPWKNHSFDYTDFCRQSNVSAF